MWCKKKCVVCLQILVVVLAVAGRVGCLSAEELQSITTELDKTLRMIRALETGVNGFAAAGMMTDAKKMATGILTTAGLNSSKHGAYVLQLIREGRDKEANAIVARAYDYADGKTIRAAQGEDGQLHAIIIDAKGNERDLGAFGRQHLIKFATGVPNGRSDLENLIEIANYR